MPQPIYLPKKVDPFEQLLPMVQNLFLLKVKHNMDMKELETEAKLTTAKKGLEQTQKFVSEGRKQIIGPQKEQSGEVANIYTGNRYTAPPKQTVSYDKNLGLGFITDPMTGKTRMHNLPTGAYKEGQLKDFKIGDEIIQHKYSNGKWVSTGIKGPRYKPGVTLNLKQSSASERENLATGEASLSNLNNLRSLFDEAYVGPITGRVGKVKDIWGGNPEKQSNFNAATSAFKNQIIKEITGAQMSEPEAKRIMKQVPDVNDPPSVWKAKWNQSKRNVTVLRKKRLEIMRKSGIKTPESKEEYDFEWIPGQGLTPIGGE